MAVAQELQRSAGSRQCQKHPPSGDDNDAQVAARGEQELLNVPTGHGKRYRGEETERHREVRERAGVEQAHDDTRSKYGPRDQQ